MKVKVFRSPSEAFDAWMRGDRSVWDDDGKPIIPVDEIGNLKEVPCQTMSRHTT